jgi:hypothetical protein
MSKARLALNLILAVPSLLIAITVFLLGCAINGLESLDEWLG